MEREDKFAFTESDQCKITISVKGSDHLAYMLKCRTTQGFQRQPASYWNSEEIISWGLKMTTGEITLDKKTYYKVCDILMEGPFEIEVNWNENIFIVQGCEILSLDNLHKVTDSRCRTAHFVAQRMGTPQYLCDHKTWRGDTFLETPCPRCKKEIKE